MCRIGSSRSGSSLTRKAMEISAELAKGFLDRESDFRHRPLRIGELIDAYEPHGLHGRSSPRRNFPTAAHSLPSWPHGPAASHPSMFRSEQSVHPRRSPGSKYSAQPVVKSSSEAEPRWPSSSANWRTSGLKASAWGTRPDMPTGRARRSSPELCVKVRGSSSMLLLGCLGDLLRFEKREIQVATFAPDRSSP